MDPKNFEADASDWVSVPLELPNTMACEVCGAQRRDGETLLYIHCMAPRYSMLESRDYWLALDTAGRPVAIRRCVWDVHETDDYESGRAEAIYIKAGDGEKVVAPK